MTDSPKLALSHLLRPLDSNIVDMCSKSDYKDTSEIIVTDPRQNMYTTPMPFGGSYYNLGKLVFNGTFHENFHLNILLNELVIAVYKAPYRFFSNEIEFYVPTVLSQINLDLEGFEGTILTTRCKPLERDFRIFGQYGCRSIFSCLTTDLMLENPDPIEDIVLRFLTLDSDLPVEIKINSEMLDNMYKEQTGKVNRPKNFAVCHIKDKESSFDLDVRLDSVLVNGKTFNKSEIHYRTYDIFVADNTSMVLRYSQ